MTPTRGRVIWAPAIILFLAVTGVPASAASSESATVTVSANRRVQPNTGATVLEVLPVGASVEVDCWTEGEYTRDSSMWLSVAGGWVHSTLVTPVSVGQCAGVYESTPSGGAGAGAGAGGGAGSGGGSTNGGCGEVNGPVYRGDPRYSPELDRDGDGIGCENG